MKIYFTYFLTYAALLLVVNTVNAQVYDPGKQCVIDPNGDCVPNTLLSAVPFLRITPDAIGGAMGDAGIATAANPYAMHYNPAKLAFANKESELAATYTPWLRNLGLNDVYLAYLGGYKKLDDLQAFGYNLRFFSLGEISFTDASGNPLGTGRPREFELGVGYARKLSENLSAAVGGKFIYSNLASGLQVQGVDIVAANSFAADISFMYNSNPDLGTNPGSSFGVGAAISNLGAKISYTDNAQNRKEVIPTNFGLGTSYKMNIDDFNSITFALDFNKLLVPTPVPQGDPNYDRDSDGIPDYRQKGTFEGVFGSFADAPGGFKEELQEVALSFGVEYWYDQQFAVRTGYFYEHQLKGFRQYITVGFGIKYNVFGIDISYLAPTNNQRSPLDNTLRFSFSFDFANANQ